MPALQQSLGRQGTIESPTFREADSTPVLRQNARPDAGGQSFHRDILQDVELLERGRVDLRFARRAGGQRKDRENRGQHRRNQQEDSQSGYCG